MRPPIFFTFSVSCFFDNNSGFWSSPTWTPTTTGRKGSRPGPKLRTNYSDGDPDIEQPFFILKHTYCAAVLTENLFMDNREDCAFLLSDAGRKAIIGLHVDGIVAYLNDSEPEPFR